ncbi:MAG: right-handed parallel beta-helix repeat-containing protein, partial [Roseimicrobium sp.]
VSALTNHDGHQAGFWEEGWYLGANVFVDMLDTEADNQFWQLGVGAEIGTRYVELRGNYYIPLSEKQLAEERRSRETFRTSRSSSSASGGQSVTPLNNPYATGNTVVQDAMFTNYSTQITRTTTTTTTIERLFQRFEEGMEGWDAEVAILVPGLDRWMDVMIIGGYYSFDNQPFGPQQGGTGNVEGWKAGVEIRPVPALIFSGTWYEDERLTGSDWTVGVQMQIPFEAGDLGDGKNFWSRIGDSFKPRRRHLMERMAEPVSRQNTAVKIANSVKESEKVVAQKTSTSVKRVTKVVSQSQQHLVLADDIIFVNNGDAVGNGIQTGNAGGDGTAESPVDTIQAGALWAGVQSTATGRTWNVYTQGGAANYAQNVFTTADTRFISSAELIPGINGTSFGTGDRPVLLGGFTASNKEYLGVRGYNILNGYQGDDGIFTQNVRRLEVVNNIIQAAGGNGVEAYTFNDVQSNVLVADNHIIDATLDGAYLRAEGNSSMTAEVHDNEISNADGNGIHVLTGSNGAMTLIANGNVITDSGGHGISGVSDDASDLELALTGNTVRNATSSGVFLNSNITSRLIATLDGNVIESAGAQGLRTLADHGSILTFTGNHNTITSSGDAGIALISNESAELTATLIDNEISDSLYRGIQAESNLTSSLKLTAQGNSITDSAHHGVFLRSNGGSGMTADLLNNHVEDTALDGIHAEASDGSVLTLNATANSLSLIDLSAINVSSDDSASL